MKTTTILISILFLLGIAACSSSDDDNKDSGPTPDTVTPDPDTTTPDPDTTTPDPDTTTPDPDAGDDDATAPTGACTNTDDGALLATEEMRDGVSAAAKECGLGCLADPDKKACSTKCVVDKTKLSDACAGCYVDVILCSVDNCLLDCAADPDAQGCIDCQAKNKCVDPTFYDCSGLPAPKP